MLTRIGELCVDLDQCAFAKSDFASEGPKIKVYFLDECYYFSLKSQPKEYAALEKFLNAQEMLEGRNLRQVRDEVWDPFFDEMPPTLFALFVNLRHVDKLALTLYASGEGRVEAVPSGQEIVHWDNLDEALEKLQAYKNAVSEPVPMSEPFDIDPFLDEID